MTLSQLELFEVLDLPLPESAKVQNLPSTEAANVTNMLQYSIPEGKLFYPEPFIASPSYLHSDLPYLHIFQYWYWLWFMFIFLICFFFISFLTAVRWTTLRTKPRRETRGVSRSKCGDLITACVPVSWAVSIIVNESTDAIDLNDGFGTAELVVGVRAYQWGWEYYYPKSIDLNYNVRSSYSAFVGNSLRYGSSSSTNVTSNFLWRMHQNEADDRIITPAHLLLIPSDSSGVASFLNFKDIGVSTLRESSAFAKIRNFTKTYSTHLNHTPSSFAAKYHKLNSLYADENTFLNTSSFGVNKQFNANAISSLGNGFTSTVLDSASFSRFLDSSTGVNLTNQTSLPSTSPSPLTPVKSTIDTSEDAIRLTALLSNDSLNSSSSLSNSPSTLNHLDDNSDKSKLNNTTLQAATLNLVSGVRLNKELLTAQGDLSSSSSTISPYSTLTLLNSSSNPRVLNINGPSSKVLPNDQSARNLPSESLTKSDFNLSQNLNPITSNLQLVERVNRATTPYSNACSVAAGCVDTSLTAHALTTDVLTATPHSPLLSSSLTGTRSLGYDSPLTKTVTQGYTKEGVLAQNATTNRKSPVGDVFIGSREKTPRSINTAYWDTFWSTSNSSNRIITNLKSNAARTNFSLPTFPNYTDYDFRNDQALDMLEELFWEHSFSGYNFYEYSTIGKDLTKTTPISDKNTALRNCSLVPNTGAESTTFKDLSSVGPNYGLSIQMEGYSVNPTTTSTENFALLPLFAELNEAEESFTSFKQIGYLRNTPQTPGLVLNPHTFGSRSYASVFNTFRSDFLDFNWQLATSNPNTSTPELADFDGSSHGNDVRLSNPATLRLSVRNSIVNSNAFQKVFKARLDESRAHVQASSFADLGSRQPFLSDTKVPYLQLLGKNRNSFFESPLALSSSHDFYTNTAPLVEALNTPAFAFPFLSSKTSDTSRFTWIDWFSKWKYMEVQPSSVSRYSTLGVPYLRKPFDFNSTTGDKFQDTELYFTRIARSRRNFLTNWSYTPYMYNRAYVWNATSNIDSLLLNNFSSASSIQTTLDEMSWYWMSPTFASNSITHQTFSSSGNDVYAKSTWRPRTSIQSFYYNTSKLVDILSKREHLYRIYLMKSCGIDQLPQSLSATPNNPLLLELKSSFLFHDPANFGTEFTRDFIYTSHHFLSSLYLRNAIQQLATSCENLPLNFDALTKFTLFYFFSTDTTQNGKNSELYKSQFRPLKKGISSMLRLHATGAVAMPTEIRLQVLASSRDVIHSWAIPSAHIKIDCVPGYTSHRIMKFLLAGTYWGQCQEICGRYHHWMPIVVYFMKPDLFVLWCTHFVLSPSSTEHRNAAANWFQSPLRTVSI